MTNLQRIVLAATALLTILTGYRCDKSTELPDVSHIPVEVNIRRFDRDLFSLDSSRLEDQLAQLEANYPAFSQVYFGQILGSTDPRIAPEGHIPYVRGFIQHPPLRQLYDTTQVVFPDMKPFEDDLSQALRYLKFYLPQTQLPAEITAFISEYTLANFIYDQNSLAIGLDFYLGENYPYADYNPGHSNFSQYLVRTFNRDHLVMKTLLPLVEESAGPPMGERLLDQMIQKGKTLYLLDQILPETPDTVIVEFTAGQLDWCRNNEMDIWAYFLGEDLLYSSDWQLIRKYVEYSPSSPGMPEEAPGRTGAWLGWQIVKAYMKRNPNTSVEELMALSDAQMILDRSKYKPTKR